MTNEEPIKSSKKDLKGSQSIKGSAILDEQSERGNSVVGRSSTVRRMQRVYAQFNEWYRENVTYKQETLLLLWLLLPYPALAMTLQLLNGFTLTSSSYGLILKITTILASFLAIYGAEVINRRHALLRYIAIITTGEATLKTVCDAAKGKGQSRILTFLAYLFFACLTAAELSIFVTPIHSFFGYGTALRHDITRFTPNPNINIFDESIGAQWACLKCVGYSTNDALFVPITAKLSHAESGSTEFDAIMNSVQDILELEVNCFVSRPIHTRARDARLNMHILDSSYGFRSAFMDFEISAFDNFGNLKSRRCNLSSRDWSGAADINYYISSTGSVARRGVAEILPHNPKNCTMAGELCLNSPSINNLSETLIKATFSGSLYTIDSAYSKKVNLFPDPTREMLDSDYSESFANSIGMMLLLGMSQFSVMEEQISLDVDTVHVKLNVDSWISILAIVTAICTALLGVTYIVVDLLRIRKEPNELLRHISEAIVPGRVFVESNAILIKEMIQHKIPSEEWDSVPVRFGEDRGTITDPLGKLRFGKKKDIIKFKEGRAYY
jgi:hypothetical protein